MMQILILWNFLTGIKNLEQKRFKTYLKKDFQKYTESSKIAAEWDILMRKFQQKTPFTSEEDWWAPMEKVFELNF